jgi:hypothetical protein
VVDANAFAIGVVVFSIAVDLTSWRALTHVARQTSSHALAAGALHYSSGLISSVMALLDLAATRADYPTPTHSPPSASPDLSPSRAIASGRVTIDALVDRARNGQTDAMRPLVAQTPGVAGTEAIRFRCELSRWRDSRYIWTPVG